MLYPVKIFLLYLGVRIEQHLTLLKFCKEVIVSIMGFHPMTDIIRLSNVYNLPTIHMLLVLTQRTNIDKVYAGTGRKKIAIPIKDTSLK